MKRYKILTLLVLLGGVAGIAYVAMSAEKFYESKGNSIDEAIPFEYNFSFNGDPLGHFEEWCEENNGLWYPKGTDCDYLTEEAGKKAKVDLDDRKNTPVGGKKALAICQTVDIPCPENPEFEGKYSLHDGRTFIHQYKSDEHYTFYFDENDIGLFYKICVENKDECTEYKKIVN